MGTSGLLILHARGVRTHNLNYGLPMSFTKTGLKRINQTLADVFAGSQTVDKYINLIEVISLVIIGRGKVDLLAFMKQTSEAALHQTHQVRGALTGRHGDGLTGRCAFSPFLPVSVSPVLNRGTVPVQINAQPGIRGKEHIES